jgi:hypothetical protein
MSPKSIGAVPPLSYVLSAASDDRIAFDVSLDMRRRELPCGRCFHHTPDLETALAVDADDGAYVFVAGLLIDLNDEGTLDAAAIAARLLSRLLESETGFLDHLDALAGRYVVVYRRHLRQAAAILNDAFGMFKVNYAPDHAIVSSNIFLIDALIHGGARRYRAEYTERRPLWKYGGLGNLAPLHGVKILTANQRLSLVDFRTERFYPRRVLASCDHVDAADRIVALCARQQRLLRQRYTLLNSLTAGIDSRFSLATTGGLCEDQRFFTYVFIRNARADALIADRIAERMSLRHHVVLGRKFRPMADAFRSPVVVATPFMGRTRDVRSWDWYQHGHEAVNAYRFDLLKAMAPPLPPLHIRSNLYEIGRAYWNEKSGTGPCSDARDILRHSRPDWQHGASAVFEAFFAEARIDNDAVHGMNLLDVFFWEHECATWVSEILQGSDFAFNTHSYVNCRKVIECFLGVPFEQRLRKSVFEHVIATRLPMLADLPINPKRLSQARRPA